MKFQPAIQESKSPVLRQGFCFLDSRHVLGDGAIDGAEGTLDLVAQERHDRNHNDRNEGENNRVFNETLTFFLE